MTEKENKSLFKKFLHKLLPEKIKTEAKQNPKQLLISVVWAFMLFVCLPIFKIPYNSETASLLNCYYGLAAFFVICCYIYNAFDDNYVWKKRVLFILKIVIMALGCLGVYLYTINYDYITAHFHEWGSFNKVGR